MQTLVIHPKDASTDFLKPIYENLDCTVITGNCTKAEVYEQVSLHDRIITLGHGSPSGLFAVGQFINEHRGSYIIDESFANLLQEKENNVYIWCHADQFVGKHSLSGFYTGMFISEDLEAYMFDIKPKEGEIKKSNDLFSVVVGEMIENEAKNIHKYVKNKYMIPGSRVRDFNYEKIYWR
jgi:hypothetical protein